MLTITKELQNIPISFSILHDQEYNNLCLVYKFRKYQAEKRRAFSESRKEKNSYNTPLYQTSSFKLSHIQLQN